MMDAEFAKGLTLLAEEHIKTSEIKQFEDNIRRAACKGLRQILINGITKEQVIAFERLGYSVLPDTDERGFLTTKITW